jgi:hypothetical protein
LPIWSIRKRKTPVLMRKRYAALCAVMAGTESSIRKRTASVNVKVKVNSVRENRVTRSRNATPMILGVS